jgi:hypothetical protein
LNIGCEGLVQWIRSLISSNEMERKDIKKISILHRFTKNLTVGKRKDSLLQLLFSW